MKSSLLILFLFLPGLSVAETKSPMEKTYREVSSASYCYLPFLTVYDAALYRAEKLQEQSDSVCLKLSYRRSLKADTLARATEESFVEQHGDELARRYAIDLMDINQAYRDVTPDVYYLYCLEGGQGTLSFNEQQLLRFEDTQFSKLYMQIWVDDPYAERPTWQFRDCS